MVALLRWAHVSKKPWRTIHMAWISHYALPAVPARRTEPSSVSNRRGLSHVAGRMGRGTERQVCLERASRKQQDVLVALRRRPCISEISERSHEQPTRESRISALPPVLRREHSELDLGDDCRTRARDARDDGLLAARGMVHSQ